jgi:hypothetical protein
MEQGREGEQFNEKRGCSPIRHGSAMSDWAAFVQRLAFVIYLPKGFFLPGSIPPEITFPSVSVSAIVTNNKTPGSLCMRLPSGSLL